MLTLLARPAAAAEPAAVVETVKGRAWARSPDGSIRVLEKDSPVFEGDRVTTEARAGITLRFRDRTELSLGPEADLEVERYRYGGEDDGFSTRMFKGAFRFLTGLMAKAKPDSMSISAAVVTVGIRGTHVAGEVDETSATIILLEPEEKDRKTSIEVFNQFGSVTIDEPGFGTEVPDQFSPPSPPRRMRLRAIENILRTLQTIQRPRLPTF